MGIEDKKGKLGGLYSDYDNREFSLNEIMKAEKSMTPEQKKLSEERETSYNAGRKKAIENMSESLKKELDEIEKDQQEIDIRHRGLTKWLLKPHNSPYLYDEETKRLEHKEFGYRGVYEIMYYNKALGIDFFKKMNKADLAKILSRHEDKDYIDDLFSLFSSEDIENLYYVLENCVDMEIFSKTKERLMNLLGDSEEVKADIQRHESKNQAIMDITHEIAKDKNYWIDRNKREKDLGIG